MPKLNYAGFLLQTAAKSHLDALDRIQLAATRIMLGTLKCTPIIYLEVEAGLLPLHIWRRKTMSKDVAKILTIDAGNKSALRDYGLKFAFLHIDIYS